MTALLVELLVEELPPKTLKTLGAAFADGIAAGLRAQGLLGDAARVESYATPRRLAVAIDAVAAKAADRALSVKLMPAAIGLDAKGEPTPALMKKLASVGAGAADLARLERRADGKAETLFLATTLAGATLADGLQKALDEAIVRLPIAKVMQYQLADGWTSVSFVRPAHGLVALHGEAVVPVQALGLQAGRSTRGHRFEAATPEVVLRSASSYAEQLRDEGAVIAGFAERRAEIARQLAAAAAREEGLTPIVDEALLDEVTGLVEKPNVLVCEFEPAFLEVPPECLILTMKANQKYFPLLDPQGRLSHRFLIVSNIAPADPSRVIEGNERVVRPRLADARFFFDQDRKKSLAERVIGLDRVVYHGKLGSQGERSRRVMAIAEAIANEAYPNEYLGDGVKQAASLAKADLLTDMVGEFPELQGVMGGYYARHDGLPEAVAEAIEDHYKPRFAGDSLPRGPVGVIVALADKLESLVGLFGVGQQPTGDKDPFALRRQALGVIRMLMEVPVPITLERLVAIAVPVFAGQIEDPSAALQAFLRERLAGNLREQGYGAREVEAVLSRPPDRLGDLQKRLAAVRMFLQLPEAAALAAANKRVGNILRKSAGESGAGVRAELLAEPAERALHAALLAAAPQADAAFARGDYAASLQALAALKAPVDAFFDDVMVNAEDPAVRANRLALLAALHAAMNRVADLASLAT